MSIEDVKPLPYVRDPRHGGVLTYHDLPKKGERERWTKLYKTIVAQAIQKDVISMEEACDRYCTTVRELKRWITLLEEEGMNSLKASNLRSKTLLDISSKAIVEYGGLSINLLTDTVTIEGQIVHFPKLDLKVLTILVQQAPNIVSRDDLYTLLYGHLAAGPDPKILDVLVCKIRKILQSKTAIQTIWGRGWRWVGMA